MFDLSGKRNRGGSGNVLVCCIGLEGRVEIMVLGVWGGFKCVV